MNIDRVDHFVITTSSLEKCLHFYVDFLSMEHKIETGEKSRRSLHFGNQKINIHTYAGEFQPAAKQKRQGEKWN